MTKTRSQSKWESLQQILQPITRVLTPDFSSSSRSSPLDAAPRRPVLGNYFRGESADREQRRDLFEDGDEHNGAIAREAQEVGESLHHPASSESQPIYQSQRTPSEDQVQEERIDLSPVASHQMLNPSELRVPSQDGQTKFDNDDLQLTDVPDIELSLFQPNQVSLEWDGSLAGSSQVEDEVFASTSDQPDVLDECRNAVDAMNACVTKNNGLTKLQIQDMLKKLLDFQDQLNCLSSDQQNLRKFTISTLREEISSLTHSLLESQKTKSKHRGRDTMSTDPTTSNTRQAGQSTSVPYESLADAITRVTKDVDAKLSGLRNELHNDLENFVRASEGRITKNVLHSVSENYNRIGIQCIKNKNTVLRGITEFQNAVANQFDRVHEVNVAMKENHRTFVDSLNKMRQDLNDHINVCPLPAAASETFATPNPGRIRLTPIEKLLAKPQKERLAKNVGSPTLADRYLSTPQRKLDAVRRNVFEDCDISAESQDSQESGKTAASETSQPASGDGKKYGRLSKNRGRLISKVRRCGSQIKDIISQEIDESTSRAKILEITNYDLPTLQSLRKEMEGLEKLVESTDLEQTMAYIDKIFDQVRKWESNLNKQRKKHHMHLSSEKNLLRNVDLPKFDGSPYGQTIYSFLSTFFRFAEKACSPEDQAMLIFNTYLSNDIKREVEAFQTDIEKIKAYLLDRYGDLRDIAETRLQAIGSLKHPGQSDSSQIEYYKKVSQSLLQVESLGSIDMVNKDEINGVIFTATYVRHIVSHLPELIIDNFSEQIEAESKHGKPKGSRYFSLLKDIVDQRWKYLSTKTSIKSMKDNPSQQQKSRSTHVSDSPKKKSKGQSVNAVNNKNLHFACPFHKNHELGYCTEFLSGSNFDRRQMCLKNAICWTCFDKDCLKSKQHKCIKMASLPKGFVCSDCTKYAKTNPSSILTCARDSHTKLSSEDIATLVESYLKKVDNDLMTKLKSMFNLVFNKSMTDNSDALQQSRVPRSKSTFDKDAVIPSYDTASGNKISPQNIRQESSNDAVYIFQLLGFGDKQGLVFYDTGANSNLVRGEFAEEVGFKTIDPENQRISGVANMSMWAGYGIYACALGPDKDGDWWQLGFQGISQITNKIPKYSWNMLNREARNWNIVADSEVLPSYVGGQEVDMILGIKSSELVPSLEYTLPSGIGLYRCPFVDTFGSRLAYGGSHEAISSMNKTFGSVSMNQLAVMLSRAFDAYMGSPWMTLSNEVMPYKPTSIHLGKFQSQHYDCTPVSSAEIEVLDTSLPAAAPQMLEPDCACHERHICLSQISKAKIPLSKLRQILEPEEPIVNFRCEECEACKKCSGSPVLKSSSIRERMEGRLIQESVHLDYLQQRVVIKLPFTVDPVNFLKIHFKGNNSNFTQALAVYKQQCRKKSDVKMQVNKAMNELIALGFLAPLKEADDILKNVVKSAPVQHYHIWRPVFKDSLSTPVRLIVDPSSTMLNLSLAKADSGLNSMFSILLRFRSSPEVWSADVTKLYNQLHLSNEAVPYSLLLYHKDLDEFSEPDVFYMTRGWYGVISTGSQAAAALRRAGKDHADSHPLGSESLLENLYVDDVNDGQDTVKICQDQVAEVQEILSHIGMRLKYVAYSKSPPPPEASKDGITMTVLGMSWQPEADLISLNIPEVNFHKKNRGVKPPNSIAANDPSSIETLCESLPLMTRRHVVSKIGEFYDSTGIAEPIKAHYKRAASRLNHLDWNDPIDKDERDFWTKNLKEWPQIAKISVPRSTIPQDAKKPHVSRLIVCADASDQCGGACVYECYQTTANSWSCQLLTARSQLLKMSVPRNELHAITMAVELAFAVIVSLNKPFQDVLFITNSLVSLCWVNNERSRNKIYVQNQIITIHRYLKWIRDRCGPLTNVELVHIPGTMNPADLMTKGQPTAKDISEDSQWINGFPWMKSEISEMPLTRFEDISLSKDEAKKYLEEVLQAETSFIPDQDESVPYMLYQSA